MQKKLLQPNKQNATCQSVHMQKLYMNFKQESVFWDQRRRRPTKKCSFSNLIKYRILPSTWLSSPLCKLTNTSFAKGNVEQLHPCAFLTFSMSSKGAMGRISADGKCGCCGVAFSDNSCSTRKSHISSMFSSSLSSGWNYVKEKRRQNIKLDLSIIWHAQWRMS